MSDYAIKTTNLTVEIGNNIILDNINVEINKGDFVAIVGPNGSGKTTFLKALLNIIKPAAGEIKIFGNKLDEIEPGDIGYVPQIKTIDRSFPANAIELVLSGVRARWLGVKTREEKKLAIQMLSLVGAEGYAKKQISELSGGQLQRVYLARCFASNPKLLLLDEPATGVDLVCEATINEIIEEYNKRRGVTVLMVTHDWTAAYHHTNKVMLLNKQLIYFGNTGEAFTELNLMKTFSHLGHKHKVTFGLKSYE
ncbi:MAG TPA: ABC transporter ATP-binding protein [Candidatus Kapabacteria bacterium]|jgi:zinc transport system ATP-binding protein|nr:ABC transporter ATP-binding protein [Candidatus Kapabacteria bacterium]HOM04719.1 ABC transporter ATP-binding protein [Candidatus Kapabacteria bacterium]HOQ50095.1 ABC transporter ATP-binding protein [Candidatus Kapabacteria bacterium]HPP39487.1 ABC transporter ATP-binding protein [Candidatus Kapabacteria bacterium]